MTRESAVSRATRHFDEGRFIEDLARRVAPAQVGVADDARAQPDVPEVAAGRHGRDPVDVLHLAHRSLDRLANPSF